MADINDRTTDVSILDNESGDAAGVVTHTDGDDNLDGTKGVNTAAVLYGRVGDEKVVPLGIDSSTGSIQVIDYPHHEIHGGSHFFVAGVADLGNSDVLDFTWLMPDTAKWTHWTWVIETEDEVQWYVYENATEDSALANTFTPLNNNRNSSKVSGTTMKYEVFGTLAAANSHTDVTGATVLEQGIAGQRNSKAGDAERNAELILKQGTLYCLRAIASVGGYVNFKMGWYEHTDKN